MSLPPPEKLFVPVIPPPEEKKNVFELLGVPGCVNTQRVLFYSAFRSLDVKFVEIDVKMNEHKKVDFLKYSPMGKLPVLLDKSVPENVGSVYGIRSILNYLQRFGGDEVVVKDDDSSMRSKSESLIDTILSIDTCFKHFLHSFKGVDKEKGIWKRCDDLFEKFLHVLEYLEKCLHGKAKLLGEKIMEADCLFAPWVILAAKNFGLNYTLFRLTNIDRYVKAISTDEKVKELFKPNESRCCEKTCCVDLKKYQNEFIDRGRGLFVLPGNFVPKRYDLEISPDMEKFTFEALVDISYELRGESPVKEIHLNQKELKVKSCVLIAGEVKVEPYLIVENESTSRVSFFFKEELPAKGVFHIEYTGSVNTSMEGFYRAKYLDASGKQKFMGSTQMEAVGARKALPCYDEPSAKAIFRVAFVVPDNFTVLGNMNEVSRGKVKIGEMVKFQFDDSPIMSTYLLAWCVFETKDFAFKEARTKDGKLLVRVWSVAQKVDMVDFALQTTVKVVPLYEDYFQEKFPLPKLDLIAVPEFAAGAMENWGLITYRETALLYKEGVSSASFKQRIASVVVHEVAHMWFGNLVTMKWWVDLWLNEGFAVWCQYYFTNELYPEFEIMKQFVTSDYARAMKMDSMASSHPIKVHVTHGHQIDEIFDVISYSKACVIVKMIAEYMGIEKFQKGVISYLKEFKYSNAETDDLTRHLEAAFEGKPIAPIMDSWTKQTGFPLVYVKKNGRGKYSLTQKKFFATGIDEKDETIWIIPLTYISSKDPKKVCKTLMTERTFQLDLNEEVEWIKINPDLTGFYRVIYEDKESYAGLEKVLPTPVLSTVDRFSIQDDVFNLVNCGLLDISQCLDIFRAYQNEESYTVINGISTNISQIFDLIKYSGDEKMLGKFKTFARSIFSKIKEKFPTWQTAEGMSHLEIFLHRLVFQNLIMFEDSDKIKEAMEVDPESVQSDLKLTVYSTFVKYGGRENFQVMKKKFEESTSSEEKVKILYALGSSKDIAIAKEALNYMLTEKVKNQDKVYLFMSVSRNTDAGDLVWKFFTENAAKIGELYKGQFLMSYFIKTSCSIFSSEDKIAVVKEFFEKNSFPSVEMSIQQAIEGITVKAAQLKRIKNGLEKWLEEKY